LPNSQWQCHSILRAIPLDMPSPLKSYFLRGVSLTAGLVAWVCVSPAAERPLVGALRWDAWYSDKGPVKETERTLGPPKYHFRLPWFAQWQGGDQVHINGDT